MRRPNGAGAKAACKVQKRGPGLQTHETIGDSEKSAARSVRRKTRREKDAESPERRAHAEARERTSGGFDPADIAGIFGIVLFFVHKE